MELEKEPTKIYKIFKDGRIKNWYVSLSFDAFPHSLSRDYWTKFLQHVIRLLKIEPEETGLFIIEQPNANTAVDDYAKICFGKIKFHNLYIASQPGMRSE
jgi:hypothetical protein